MVELARLKDDQISVATRISIWIRDTIVVVPMPDKANLRRKESADFFCKIRYWPVIGYFGNLNPHLRSFFTKLPVVFNRLTRPSNQQNNAATQRIPFLTTDEV